MVELGTDIWVERLSKFVKDSGAPKVFLRDMKRTPWLVLLHREFHTPLILGKYKTEKEARTQCLYFSSKTKQELLKMAYDRFMPVRFEGDWW